MINIRKVLPLAVAAIALFAGSANAQTVTVPVNATVANTIAITQVDPLDFATLVAINDATEIATATLSTADALTFATTNPPALMQVASGTPTAAELTTAGVVGATINATISAVVDPVNGTDVLTLDTFTQSVNGAAEAGVTVGTAFTYTATALDTVLIGADLSTPAVATQIADGPYLGSFDFTVSF